MKEKNVTNLEVFPNISTNFNYTSFLKLSVNEEARRSDSIITFGPVIFANGNATVIFLWHVFEKLDHAQPQFHAEVVAA